MIRRTLICDRCLIVAEGPDGVIHANNAEAAREQAREVAAWTRRQRRDLCPDCQDES